MSQKAITSKFTFTFTRGQIMSEEKQRPGWEVYPYPIASILHKVLEAGDPIARFIQLGHLFEVLLRYLSTVILGVFFYEKKEIPSSRRMVASLEHPSLGHWCEILRTLPKKLEKAQILKIREINLLYANQQAEELREAYRALQYFLGKKKEKPPKTFSIATFFELLVAFRNKTKGHGAIQAEFAGQINPLLENSLERILEVMEFLLAYPLSVAEDGGESIKLMGWGKDTPPQSPVFLCNDQGSPWLPLSPMVLWQEKKFWFMNGWKNREVEYLCYDTGELYLADFSNIAHLVEDAFVPHGDLAKNVQIEIAAKKVYEFAVDGAVMAQDTNRVFGPVQPLEIDPDQDLKQEIRQVIDELTFEFEPNKPAEVIVSKRSWCRARYLIEAIIYDLDQPDITSDKVIREAFDTCFARIADLGLTTVAMNPLGTEYQKMSEENFVRMFVETYNRHKSTLAGLTRIILVPREEKQVDALAAAVEKAIQVKPKIQY